MNSYRLTSAKDQYEMVEENSPTDRVIVEEQLNIEEATVSIKESRDGKLKICVALFIVCAIGFGIGIGIGFAISNNNQSSEYSEDPDKNPDISTPGYISEDPDISTPGYISEDPDISTPGYTSEDPAKEKWQDVKCSEENFFQCPDGYTRKPPLLLISMDGYRAEYFERGLSPNLKKMSDCGVYTPYMKPVFPTKTFPNHYSIVTGLYPESHGIIENTMYDPDFNTVFSLGNPESLNPRWWQGEPIWVTAEKQNKKTATYFWPGSDVEIQGVRPTYWYLYDGNVPYKERIDTVLNWLNLPEENRPDFMTLYFEEPDSTGHNHGTESNEVNEMLKEMDDTLETLLDGITGLGLHKCINILIVADHGMQNRSCDKLYKLRDYMDIGGYYIYDGTMARINPKDDDETPEQITEPLECKNSYVVPYAKQDLPKRYHYANNDRIEDVVVEGDEGWIVSDSANPGCGGATHGWNNNGVGMRALFLAYGPAFKQNYQKTPFLNIELYYLMAELLGVTPAPNNGTVGSMYDILQNPPDYPDSQEVQSATACPYPSTDADYETRLQEDVSSCFCNTNDFTDLLLKDINKRLNLSENEINMSLEKHAPNGIPGTTFDKNHCGLNQQNYLTGFSNDLKMPLWVSYTIDKNTQHQALNETCYRADVRVSPDTTPNCFHSNYTSSDNFTQQFLMPPDFADNETESLDAMITSNMVPMFYGFFSEIWQPLGDWLYSLATTSSSIERLNVVSGPIFDYNYDGLKDNETILEDLGYRVENTYLPTHFFIILAKCSDGNSSISECEEEMEIQPLILQHSDGVISCQNLSDLLKRNVATVKDIELLTGLTFYPNLSYREQLNFKLYLPLELW